MDRRTPRRGAVVTAALALAVLTTASTPHVATAVATRKPPPAAAPLPTWLERPARVVLIGDSVAASAADAIRAEAARRGIDLATYTRAGCGITDGIPVGTNNVAFSAACVQDNDAFLGDAAALPTDAVIVMSSWEINSHLVQGTLLGFRTPEWDQWMAGQLEAISARFGNAPLLLATVAPRAPIGPVATTSPEETAGVLLYDDFLRDYATWRPGKAGIVDVHAILCPTDAAACPEQIHGVTPRPDLGAHFDAGGAAWFAPRMLDGVEQAWTGIGAVVTAPPGF